LGVDSLFVVLLSLVIVFPDLLRVAVDRVKTANPIQSIAEAIRRALRFDPNDPKLALCLTHSLTYLIVGGRADPQTVLRKKARDFPGLRRFDCRRN
jgi:hypothetical protein